MSAHRTPAITLRTYNYDEAHRIVVLLTPDRGLVRGVAYGARKSQSRFGSALEPMTLVQLSFSRKENQELATISGCEIVKGRDAAALSMEENLYFSYFAEMLIEFAREEAADARLFRLARALLEAVGRKPIELLARFFDLWVLQLEGILPPLEEKLPDETAVKARRLMRLPPAELAEDLLSAAELARLESLTAELIQCHLEKPLKSRRLLKELL